MTLASETQMESGYAHPAYALSLSEFGRPRPLAHSGGWVLERSIPGEDDARDAMGCYPIFSCRDWSSLNSDFENLGDDLVSLVLVADPFGDFSEESLRGTFQDLLMPFKEHFVVDLRQPLKDFVDSHHQRNARKAMREIEVEQVTLPETLLEEWTQLYANLIDRHAITGIARFSHSSFAQQLRVPGIVAFRALQGGQTVGISLWYTRADVGYYHLAAYSEEGYRLRASFALFWKAIEYFAAAGLRWLDLGAGAGAANNADDGLTRFKRGWTNTTRMAYLCGRVFNEAKYRELSAARNPSPQNRYFPSYRVGEFA
ncbi:MAG: hypothetical protein QOH88_851 [Verrucomicrobiota bacterium]|jgi:hypothetical protein